MSFSSVCIFTLLFFSSISITNASDTHLDDMLKRPSSFGKNFWFSLPTSVRGNSSDFVRVYLLSNQHGFATLNVLKSGKEQRVELQPNTVITIDLDPAEVYPTRLDSTIRDQICKQSAVHLQSTVQMSVRVLCNTGRNSEAMLVRPIESLARSYRCAAAPSGPGGSLGLSQIVIVAASDSTIVQCKVGGNRDISTGSNKHLDDTMSVWLEHAGDSYLITSSIKGSRMDLSGTTISSSKPVAVITGSGSGKDTTLGASTTCRFENMVPTVEWGHFYPIPRVSLLESGSALHLIANTAMTIVQTSPNRTDTLRDANGELGKGWISVEIPNRAEATVLNANHSIAVELLSNSQPNSSLFRSGVQLQVIPFEQYYHGCLVSTLGTEQKRSFPRQWLGLVVPLTSNAVVDPAFQIARCKADTIEWMSLSDFMGGLFPAAYVYPGQFPNGGRYAYVEVPIMSELVLAMRCPSPFAAYSYGSDGSHSYALPAAVMAKYIQAVPDTVAPTISYNMPANHVTGSVIERPSAPEMSGLAKYDLYTSDSLYSFNTDMDLSKRWFVPSMKFQLQHLDSLGVFQATLVCSDHAGNVSEQTFNMNGSAIPRLRSTSGRDSMCTGDVLFLYVTTKSDRYEWSTGDSTQNIRYVTTSPGAHMISVRFKSPFNPNDTMLDIVVYVFDTPSKPQLDVSSDTLLCRTTAQRYQWFKDNYAIAGATESAYIAKTSGTYKVVLHNGPCTNASESVKIELADVTDIEQLTAYSCYPNPTNDELYVRLGSATVQSVELFNCVGQLVSANFQLEPGLLRLQMGPLTKGCYSLSLRDQGGVHRLSFIRQ